MHRDKKVGLALAILLCSIVGAFFFRDDAPRNNGPELKDGQRLDQEIARGNSRGPYSDAESRTRGTDPRRPADPSRESFPPSNLSDHSASGNSTAPRNRVLGSRDPSLDSDRNGNPFDRNPLTPPPQDAPARSIPLLEGGWEPATGNDGAVVHRGGTEVGPATTGLMRSHVVVDGETLSSIAGKYLGSQTRYQEIYQANRNLLKTADDLKIGMKLMIPERSEPRATRGQRGNSPAESTANDRFVKPTPPINTVPSRVTDRPSEPAEPVDTRKPRFIKPAKPSSAFRRTTDASDEANSVGKTLSQTAPNDLLEIDEGILAELERSLEPQVAEKPADTGAPR